MIRITIELLPLGDESKAEHLGTAIIANDGTGDVMTGNYTVMLSKWKRPKEAWKRGTVKGFDRIKRGPWDLMFLALLNTVGTRNPRGYQATNSDHSDTNQGA